MVSLRGSGGGFGGFGGKSQKAFRKGLAMDNTTVSLETFEIIVRMAASVTRRAANNVPSVCDVVHSIRHYAEVFAAAGGERVGLKTLKRAAIKGIPIGQLLARRDRLEHNLDLSYRGLALPFGDNEAMIEEIDLEIDDLLRQV